MFRTLLRLERERERETPPTFASHNRFMVIVEADPRERLFPILQKQQQQQKLFRVQATQLEEGNERAAAAAAECCGGCHMIDRRRESHRTEFQKRKRAEKANIILGSKCIFSRIFVT